MGMDTNRIPLPPRDKIIRVGAPHYADDATVFRYFDRSGRHRKRAILDLVPEGYAFDGRRVLDFGCGPGRVLRHFLPEAETAEFWGCDPHAPSIEWVSRNLSPPVRAYVSEDPPLPHPDEYFDLIYGISVFTHITHEWSAWLLELHRILKPGGLLISTFLGPPTWEEIAQRPVEEDELGIAFLALHQGLSETSGPNVLHSPWWIREHWGRAFEILALRPDGFVTAGEGHGVVVGRKRDVVVSREDLEAPGDDPREKSASRLQDELHGAGPPPVRKRRFLSRAFGGGFRRNRRTAGDRSATAPAPAPQNAWLRPILVDHSGRDGSTLMMRLLLTSPEIAVEPPYPYEKKYFAYLVRWARLLDREDWQGEQWSPASVGSLVQEERSPMLGPPPWAGRRSFEPPEGDPDMSDRAFGLVWTEFSRRAIVATRSLHPGTEQDARYYAEKHLHTWRLDRDQLPSFRPIILLRDPRDVYVSVNAFNRKREGEPSIGQHPREPVQRWRQRFIRAQRLRLRWLAAIQAASGGNDAIIVRYEDLVNDLPGQAARLERALSVTLDAEATAADTGLLFEHGTSSSPEDSIGRWRVEMTPNDAKLFKSALGEELAALGFDV